MSIIQWSSSQCLLFYLSNNDVFCCVCWPTFAPNLSTLTSVRMGTSSVRRVRGTSPRLDPFQSLNILWKPFFCCAFLFCYLLLFNIDETSSSASFATSHLSQTLAASSSSFSSSSRVVTTRYGSLRGNLVRLSSKTSPEGQQTLSPAVEAFLGVPYATPPTGGLRFMPPVTPSHWRGVRPATAPSAVCPQTIPSDVLSAVRAPDAPTAHRRASRARHESLRRLVPLLGNQSEDCLYLNLYVPLPMPTSSNAANTANSQGE